MKVELNSKELDRLFEETIKEIGNMKESIMFNLYEDSDSYSMETAFDDEEYVVCRDNPAVLCSNEIDYKKVLKAIKEKIQEFIDKNNQYFENVEEISYGFVDGDLLYLKKRKKKKQIEKFTAESFKDFDSFRLKAWLGAYLTDKALKIYNPPGMFSDIEFSEEEMKEWKQILAENFDYKKYNKD